MSMRQRLAAFTAIALLAGSFSAPALSPPPDYFITDEGMPPVVVGMSRDDALKALGAGWKYEAFPDGGQDISGDVCGYIFSEAETTMFAFMLEGGKVVRADAVSPDAKTEKGIHIGSTEEDVRKAYGDAVISTPHQYQGAPAAYLTVWTKDGPKSGEEWTDSPTARGIRFSTNEQKKVEAISGGGSAIQYVEGCA